MIKWLGTAWFVLMFGNLFYFLFTPMFSKYHSYNLEWFGITAVIQLQISLISINLTNRHGLIDLMKYLMVRRDDDNSNAQDGMRVPKDD